MPRDATDLIGFLEDCQKRAVPVFFFGSEPEVVYRLRDRVAAGFPALKIAGICDADFEGPVSLDIIRHIVASRPGAVVTDMPDRDFVRLVRSLTTPLAPAQFANFQGAFPVLASPAVALPLIACPFASSAARSGRREGPVRAAVRFAAIIGAQFLRSLLPARRLSGLGAGLRRRD